MPLGVANDWRVERSLVGTWKSSVTPSRLSEPRKKAQKPPCKDFEPKEPPPIPFGSRPLTFRFTNRAFLRSINLYTPQFAPQATRATSSPLIWRVRASR